MRPKLVFPVWYGQKCTLVELDRALVPIVAGALKHLESRDAWATELDYFEGYNAIAELRESLMGKCIQTLQMEIRALRGVDDLQPGYDDPDANPFDLSLGTIEDNKRQLEAINAKLEAIRLLITDMQNAETLAQIRDSAARIALLLA